MKYLLLFLLLTHFTSCQTPLSKWSYDQFKKHQRSSDIHKKGYWDKWINLPLEERVIEGTDEIIQFITDDNIYNHYRDRPSKIKLSAENLAVIKEALASLPSWIKKPIEDNITAIIILKDVGGSALTDKILSFKNKGFIIFDIKTLTKSANDWCTWKESSPFKEGTHKLKCIIEEERYNDKVGAFRYIFLHEAAHILNLSTDILPYWNIDLKSEEEVEAYSFLKESWHLGKKSFLNQKRKYKRISFTPYYKEKDAVKNNLMLEYYKELSQSDFPTLYGTKNPWDDFAESYVNYIHTQVFKKPFRIEIYNKEKLVYTYKDCWNSKRCKKKKALLRNYLMDRRSKAN